MLRYPRVDHRPHSESGGCGVKYRHQSSEERDVRAGSVYAEKVQSTHYRYGEDAQGNQCAELQEHADQDCRGVGLKVRDDDIGRFPGSRPVGSLNPEWDPEGADGAQSGVEKNCIDDR